MPQLKDLIIKTEKVNWQELKDLQPNNLKNPYHTENLKKSLVKNGFAFSFYVWEDKNGDKYLVDGHLRSDVLIELKNEGFDIPDELSCTFLDLPNRKTAIKYLLEVFNQKTNPINKESLDDWFVLEEIEDIEVEVDWLNVEELEEVEVEELEAQEDDFEEPEPNQIKTDIVKGDIFEFRKDGKTLHRLLCGDSTCSDTVAKLMNGNKADIVFTDPPYGINVVNKNGKVGGGTKQYPTAKFSEIIGDDTTETAKEFYDTCISLGMNKFIIWGGNYFTDFLETSRCWIVWFKNHIVDRTFANCELAWTNIDHNSKTYQITWDGYTKEGESGSKVHPSQKPIKLCADVLLDFTNESNIIYDGFLGSGSTMVASHQLNRKCYGMELDEKYCQVIVDRMKKLDPELEIVKI